MGFNWNEPLISIKTHYITCHIIMYKNYVRHRRIRKRSYRNFLSLKRISRPGLRIYSNYQQIPRILGGMEIVIISTSRDIMTDREARLERIGGEHLALLYLSGYSHVAILHLPGGPGLDSNKSSAISNLSDLMKNESLKNSTRRS